MALKPYAGENYTKNSSRVRGDAQPCAHCGKAIKRENIRYTVEIYDGGATYARESTSGRLCDEKFAAGYLGYIPVGPECKRILEADGIPVLDWKGIPTDFNEPTVNNEVV